MIKYCEIKELDKPRDEGWGRGRRPVLHVSWDDATKYVEWLSKLLDTPYILPTQAEWEFSCSLGRDAKWYFGDDEFKLQKYAWYEKNSDNKTHLVGVLKPNESGLYDMHGNVWEWCSNWYEGDKHRKVLKGGSWYNLSQVSQTDYSSRYSLDYSDYNVGFRLLRTLP